MACGDNVGEVPLRVQIKTHRNSPCQSAERGLKAALGPQATQRPLWCWVTRSGDHLYCQVAASVSFSGVVSFFSFAICIVYHTTAMSAAWVHEYCIVYQRRLQIPLTSSLLMVLYTEISELFCTSFRLALVSKILLKTLSECESRIVGRSPNWAWVQGGQSATITGTASGCTAHRQPRQVTVSLSKIQGIQELQHQPRPSFSHPQGQWATTCLCSTRTWTATGFTVTKYELLSGISKQSHLAKHKSRWQTERELANQPRNRREAKRSVTSGALCSTLTVPAMIRATLRQRLTPLTTDELCLDTAHAVSVKNPAMETLYKPTPFTFLHQGKEKVEGHLVWKLH